MGNKENKACLIFKVMASSFLAASIVSLIMCLTSKNPSMCSVFGHRITCNNLSLILTSGVTFIYAILHAIPFIALTFRFYNNDQKNDAVERIKLVVLYFGYGIFDILSFYKYTMHVQDVMKISGFSKLYSLIDLLLFFFGVALVYYSMKQISKIPVRRLWFKK